MNIDQNKEVMKRAGYFITHYLPWILLLLVVVGIFICGFHYINKTCSFEKKDKESTVETHLLPYIKQDVEK